MKLSAIVDIDNLLARTGAPIGPGSAPKAVQDRRDFFIKSDLLSDTAFTP
jgi:hypothetical protein